MGCGYCDNDGKCMVADSFDPLKNPLCPIDEQNNCRVEDDPDPSFSCDQYWCVDCRNESCNCDTEEEEEEE